VQHGKLFGQRAEPADARFDALTSSEFRQSDDVFLHDADLFPVL
jgi:hypothetical protein